MTYENGGGVDTSEDCESANPNDIVVEQRGTGLIILDRLLKPEIPGMTRRGLVPDTDYDVIGTRCGGTYLSRV